MGRAAVCSEGFGSGCGGDRSSPRGLVLSEGQAREEVGKNTQFLRLIGEADTPQQNKKLLLLSCPPSLETKARTVYLGGSSSCGGCRGLWRNFLKGEGQGAVALRTDGKQGSL